jgi:hypothetical protein
MDQRRIKMTDNRLSLANELAAIRAEIARLRSRESALASIEHHFPKVPVFRRPPARQDPTGAGAVMSGAHA